eukprot:4993168-Ditylum_brightwellii.AAC.1
MSTVWSKIAHTDRNNHHRSNISFGIPESWPQIGEDVNMVTDLENPKKEKVLHFGQATGTPFTVPPLSIEVDWAANFITSESILEGNCTNKEINAFT